MTADRIPTLKEELERKTVEILEETLQKLDAHEMDAEQGHTICHTLWKVTAGLVGNDVSVMCEQAATQTRGSGLLKRSFIGDGQAITFAWHPDRDDYLIRVLSLPDQTVLRSDVRKCPAEQRGAKLTEAFQRLTVDHGFKQL